MRVVFNFETIRNNAFLEFISYSIVVLQHWPPFHFIALEPYSSLAIGLICIQLYSCLPGYPFRIPRVLFIVCYPLTYFSSFHLPATSWLSQPFTFLTLGHLSSLDFSHWYTSFLLSFGWHLLFTLSWKCLELKSLPHLSPSIVVFHGLHGVIWVVDACCTTKITQHLLIRADFKEA